jgi:hypothetical protein
MATVTEYASAASGTSWTTATNANADDGAYATYTIAAKNTTGNVNTLSNFGFDSSIAAGSTINSVQLEVEHKVSTNGGIAHLESAVAISGTPGTFNTDSAEPTTDTARTYATLARPGGGSWTRNDLLDGTFTVQLRARSGNSSTSVTYSWDYARVTVDYTAPQPLTPSLYSDGDSFFSPTVGATYALTPSLFSDGDTFPSATVTPGAVALTPSLFADGDTFHAPTVASSGPQDLTPSLYTNAASFFTSTVAATYALTPSLFTDGDTFHAATVAPGAVGLTPSLFSDGDTFYSPTVAATYALTAALYSDADSFPSATVSATYALTAALYSDADTFYTPSVTSVYALTAGLFTDSDMFPSATVAPGTVNLTPALFADGDTFYSPTVSVEAQPLVPSLFTDSDTFYSATVAVAMLEPRNPVEPGAGRSLRPQRAAATEPSSSAASPVGNAAYAVPANRTVKPS